MKKEINKKRKTFVLLSIFSLIGMVLIFNIANTNANPGGPYTGTNHSCHIDSGYTVTSNFTGTVEVDPSENFTIIITAIGSGVEIWMPDEAYDNNKFTITPGSDQITDNMVGVDEDLTVGTIKVTFTIKAPSAKAVYTIFITAQDSTDGMNNWAKLELSVNVGGAVKGIDFSMFFNHLGIWLGLPALILLTIGTFLVLKKESKYVKVHGILAGTSLVLTIINVISVFISEPIVTWSGYPMEFHWPHIILGTIGLIAGFFSMLYGIAAERKNAKITGYVALVCWWVTFILGYMINPNMFVDFGTDFMSLFGG